LNELWPSGVEFLAVLTNVDGFYDCDEALSYDEARQKTLLCLRMQWQSFGYD
jgi:hypothetical protein